MEKDKKTEVITMDVLARMVAKGFSAVDKRLDGVDKRLENHDKIFQVILKEMQGYNKEAKEHRMTMSSLNHSDITHELEIEGLKIRVQKLEQNFK